MINLTGRIRQRMSRRLVRAARDPARRADMTVRQLIVTLGDRSFGWCILLFAIVNMIPMPPGGNMLTSIPLLILTSQMARGFEQVRLPAFVLDRSVSRKGFQKLVLRLGPLMRPVERMVRPRYLFVFTPSFERPLGLFLFVVAIALFMPIPLSGYIPATALLVAGFGLVERDGLVTLAGVALGVVAIVVTVVVGTMIVAGAQALAV